MIKRFWDDGRGGIYIWGDNHPLYADANALSMALVSASMSGNKCGDGKVLQVTADGPGMRAHEITTGIENLYEVTCGSLPHMPRV